MGLEIQITSQGIVWQYRGDVAIFLPPLFCEGEVVNLLHGEAGVITEVLSPYLIESDAVARWVVAYLVHSETLGEMTIVESDLIHYNEKGGDICRNFIQDTYEKALRSLS